MGSLITLPDVHKYPKSAQWHAVRPATLNTSVPRLKTQTQEHQVCGRTDAECAHHHQCTVEMVQVLMMLYLNLNSSSMTALCCWLLLKCLKLLLQLLNIVRLGGTGTNPHHSITKITHSSRHHDCLLAWQPQCACICCSAMPICMAEQQIQAHCGMAGTAASMIFEC